MTPSYTDPPPADADLLDLKFVGRATAEALEGSGVEATDITEGTLTHGELIAAGVDPGVATKIRREFDLPGGREGEPAPNSADLADAIDDLEADLEGIRTALETGDGATADRLDALEGRIDRIAARQAAISERQDRLIDSFERASRVLDRADPGE